ncbi:MAG: hypothetical protein FJ255_04270 [Phycisphaerae bacterium]|nr:hypothetical protein [Phycisphaerae bacterium]
MHALWAQRLRGLAGPVLPPGDDPGAFVRTFADDAGHRRSVDLPFLAHLLGVPPGQPATGARTTLDLDLWWALHGRDSGARPLPSPGPLIDPAPLALETWTEAELAALHALSWHARLGREWARARIDPAVEWTLAHLQPDNATNHPWAIHVFIDHGARTGAPESRLYAETLLHNCTVGTGRPERFSACILADAAAWLDGQGVGASDGPGRVTGAG